MGGQAPACARWSRGQIPPHDNLCAARRPLRRHHDGGRRHHRLGHLPQSGGRGTAGRHGRPHHRGMAAGRGRGRARRLHLRRAGRTTTGGGRRLRLPARCVRSPARVSLCVDPAAGHCHRRHRRGGDDLRQLCRGDRWVCRARSSRRWRSRPSSCSPLINVLGVKPERGHDFALHPAQAGGTRGPHPRRAWPLFAGHAVTADAGPGSAGARHRDDRRSRGALVPVLFAYGGWQQTNFVAEEMVDADAQPAPRPAVGRGHRAWWSTCWRTWSTCKVLGVGGLADSTAPAADTMQILFGPAGRTFIAVGIALSTFGFLNLAICANARVYQAMARDRHLLRCLRRLHPRLPHAGAWRWWRRERGPSCSCSRAPTASCSTTWFSVTGSSSA